MATETLNIKVKEDGGSRRTANEFKSLTKEILKAGTAVAKFKKQIKGLGGSGLTREITRAKSASDQLAQSTKRATRNVDRLGRSAAKAKGPLNTMAGSLSKVRGLLFSLGAIAAGRTFLSFSDQFQNMENRLKLVTNGTEEFTDTQKRLQDIAKNTRQSLSATTETFVRMRKATKDTGISAERLFGVQETLNKMLTLSGASAQEAEQSIRQLSQAFSKGKLDGDEFRTVSEAMPDILDALSSSLGVSRGELRKMSEAGQITTDVLIEAFEQVSEKVDKDFKESVATLGQQWQILKDQVLIAVGEFNKSSGAIELLQSSLKFLANNIGLVVFAFKALVTVMLVRFVAAIPVMVSGIVGKMIPALLSMVTTLNATSVGLARTAGNFGIFGAAALAAGLAGFKFGRMIDEASGGKLTDFFAGIGDEERASSIEESIAAITARREEEIAQLERQRGFSAFASKESIDADIAKIKSGLAVTQAGAARQIAARDLAAAEAQAAKELLALVDLEAELDKGLKANEARLAAVAGKFRPLVKVQAQYKKDAEELEESLRLLNFGLDDVAEAVAELQSAMAGRLDPVGEELKNNKLLLDIANKRTKKERENAQITKDVVEFLQQKIAANAAFFDEAGNVQFGGSKADQNEADFNRIVKSRKELAKRNKEIAAGGKSSLKKDLDALLKSVDPVLKAQEQLIKAEKVLQKAQRRGLITAEKVAEVRTRIAASTFDARKPMIAMATLLVKERDDAKLSTQELEKLNLTREVQNEIMKATGKTREELDSQVVDGLVGIKEEITRLDELRTRREEAIESLVGEKDALEELGFQLGIINELRGNGLSQADAEKEINELLLAQFKEFEKELSTVLGTTAALNEVEKERLRIRNLEAAGLELIKQKVAASNLDKVEEIELRRQLTLLIAEQTAALDTKIKKDEEEIKKAAKRAEQADKSLKGLTSGIKDLLSPEAINTQQINLITNSFTGLEDQIVSFTTTGKFDFKAMVDSMLADLTRLLFRMAIAKAMSQDIANGGGGGAGAVAGGAGGAVGLIGAAALVPGIVEGGLGLLQGLFAHGGQFKVPRFAEGGQFQVGGAGGPDTQLVQFMASPGENVRITPPGRSRQENKQQPASQGDVTINNVMDPSQFAAVLSSPAGERSVLNTIQQNPELIRRYIK